MMNRITIVTRDGRSHSEQGQYPKGHLENPMTDTEVEHKFRSLCRAPLGESRGDALLKTLWELDRQANLEKIFELAHIK